MKANTVKTKKESDQNFVYLDKKKKIVRSFYLSLDCVSYAYIIKNVCDVIIRKMQKKKSGRKRW